MSPSANVVLEHILDLHVAGVPATQGSKTAIARGGRAWLIDKNPQKLKPWREAVRSDAAQHLESVHGDTWQPLTGPVSVRLLFAVPKPASAPKRRRVWPIGARSGDADKLARSVLDSLTDAGVWRDDSQVVHLDVWKDYPGPDVQQFVPGVRITVHRITDTR